MTDFQQPSELGLLAWNYPPLVASASNTSPAGKLMVARIPLPPGLKTFSNLWFSVNTAGATLTAGQNFAAAYDNLGNLLGVSADLTATAFVATGPQGVPVGGPFTGYWPWVYGAVVANGTTPPILRRAITDFATANLSADTAHQPFFVHNAGVTTQLPAALVPSTSFANPQAFWMGLS